MFKNSLNQKANFTFYQILGIGLGFLAFFIFLIINLYPRLSLISKSLLGKLESVCGCTNHLVFANHPFIFTGLIFLGISLAVFFCFLAIKVIKIVNATNRFIKSNLKNKKQNFSFKLSQLVQFLGLEDRVVEIYNPQAVIFCFGLIKPKVCISSGLVKKLSKKELMAVLLHEQHHLSSYEPIKIFMVKLITKILFFVPGLKLLAKQYLTFSELTADSAATNNFQNKVPLAKALYKVIKLEKQSIIKNNLALSFFSGITEERVNKLADNKYIPQFKFFTAKLSFGVLFILLLPFFFNMLFSANQIGYSATLCPMTESDTSHQCEIMLTESDCALSYNLDNIPCEKQN